MGDRAPTVYLKDGTPVRPRIVENECIGEVDEGFYGYENDDGDHLSLWFDDADTTGPGIVTIADVLDLIDDRIEYLEDEAERAEKQYDPPECSACGREMKTGSLGGGEIRFGCYPPPGKEEYDCPYYQEHGFANKLTRNLRDVAPIKRQVQAFAYLKHLIVERSDPP